MKEIRNVLLSWKECIVGGREGVCGHVKERIRFEIRLLFVLLQFLRP